MKKTIFTVFIFCLICACGVFVGLAGGIQWGTLDCGALSFFTIALAFAASSLTIGFKA